MLTRISTHIFNCLIIALLVILESCSHATVSSDETIEAATPVTITPVILKSVASSIDLPAVSTFMNKSIIRAVAAGRIEKISFNPGDYVYPNQLLFSIRTREAMAMDNQIPDDSSLYFKGLINISSSNEGVISSISYQVGDFVQEGDEMAVISESNSLVFMLEVPFELEKYIDKNRRCKILLTESRVIEGTITGKLPEMDMQSQTIRYKVKPHSAERLPANLYAVINIVKSENPNALVLPKQAVLSDEAQTSFWVMKLINDSTAIKVIVKKGFENNDEVEITEPLFSDSDRIVLTGNYGLPDTARITIVNE